MTVTTTTLSIKERIMLVLSRLTPMWEYRYHRARLNLGFKRISERFPKLFPRTINFGKLGSLLDNDEIHEAMRVLDDSNFIDLILMKSAAFMRVRPLLRQVVIDCGLDVKLRELSVTDEELSEAASIIELALEDDSISTEELIVRREES